MILFKTSFDHMHFLNQVSNKCFLFYKIPLTVWPLVVTPVHPLGTAGTASRTGTRTRTTAAATLSVHCTQLFFLTPCIHFPEHRAMLYMFHNMLCIFPYITSMPVLPSKAIYHLAKGERPKAPKRPGTSHGQHAKWKRFQP